MSILTWAKNMATGEWGRTFFGGRAVRTVIFERIPATVLLMGTAMSSALLIGVFVGVLGAYKRYSIFDYLGHCRSHGGSVLSNLLVRTDGHFYFWC